VAKATAWDTAVVRPSVAGVLPASELSALFAALRADGRTVIAPTERDGALLFDDVDGPAALPAGRTEEQGPGRYRVVDRDDGRLFGFHCGPRSLKRWLHPPREELWRAESSGGRLAIVSNRPSPRVAVIGARACDLAAARALDDALAHVPHPDVGYAARRQALFVVAVQCGSSAEACFCASRRTGPRVTGFDLALTELLEPHRFVVEVGSEAGAAMADQLPLLDAGDDVGAPRLAAERAAAEQSRSLPRAVADDLRDALDADWQSVADRCLACGNCTMVCPTCFCSDVQDTLELDGTAVRTRTWDSCFSPAFTHVHGGSTRPSLAARYRHWLLHKLSTWEQQFGGTGCVGCGRCTTWCPAGIDLVAEAQRRTGG
jgi:sulfhydrogenase subunit beta (sulfur reductase)